MRGFTIIELIVVIVVVGILSTIAVTRFAGRAAFDELGYVQELASAARYAQKLAVATRCPVRLQLADATQYRLTRPAVYAGCASDTAFALQVVNPATAAAPYAGTAPSGVSMSSGGGFPETRDFTAQGGITPDSELSVQVGIYTMRVRQGSGQVVVQTPP